MCTYICVCTDTNLHLPVFRSCFVLRYILAQQGAPVPTYQQGCRLLSGTAQRKEAGMWDHSWSADSNSRSWGLDCVCAGLLLSWEELFLPRSRL